KLGARCRCGLGRPSTGRRHLKLSQGSRRAPHQRPVFGPPAQKFHTVFIPCPSKGFVPLSRAQTHVPLAEILKIVLLLVSWKRSTKFAGTRTPVVLVNCPVTD